MLFKRFYDDQLAQASYMIACQAAGDAIVVDPHRDIEFYVEQARAEGVKIRHVTETHIHADFVSGSRELAERTGATLYLSAEGGADWQYKFAAASGATLLHDGDEIALGRIRLRARHTPGHTPEHLAFLVTDLAASPEPVGMVSGDFIFAGDVGRPDLLERAAGHSGTMDDAARSLFHSLQKTRDLPDYLQIWPGHGAGSACGKALGSIPQSTLGYERLANWAFAISSASDFVREALGGQTTPPRYFANMKRVNKQGPAILGGIRTPRQIDAEALRNLLAPDGGIVVDTRPTAEYATEHLVGAISIPFNKSFTKWAGSLLNPDADFALLVQEGREDTAAKIARDLVMIGFDRLAGYATTSEMQRSKADGAAVESSSRLDAEAAARLIRTGGVTVIDVRDPHELAVGKIEDATVIPLGALPGREHELPLDRPLLVYCEGGSRSSIAASLLKAAGATQVHDIKGGFTAWARAGNEIVHGDVASVKS